MNGLFWYNQDNRTKIKDYTICLNNKDLNVQRYWIKNLVFFYLEETYYNNKISHLTF